MAASVVGAVAGSSGDVIPAYLGLVARVHRMARRLNRGITVILYSRTNVTLLLGVGKSAVGCMLAHSRFLHLRTHVHLRRRRLLLRRRKRTHLQAATLILGLGRTAVIILESKILQYLVAGEKSVVLVVAEVVVPAELPPSSGSGHIKGQKTR